MATVDVGRGNSYTGSVDAQGVPIRRPLLPSIRWSAVMAGVAVGLSVQLLLTILGVAVGLSPADAPTVSSADMTWAMIWAGLGLLVSSFAGGYVAARISGLRRRIDGLLHGSVTWAVSTLVFAILATSFNGNMLSGVFRQLDNGQLRSLARYNGADNTAIDLLLRRHLGSDMDTDRRNRLHEQIEAGQRQEAIREISSIGIDRAHAAAVVDKAMILSRSEERNARDSVANAATWGIFFAVTFSLAVGIAGGAFGAAGARRTAWAPAKTSGEPA